MRELEFPHMIKGDRFGKSPAKWDLSDNSRTNLSYIGPARGNDMKLKGRGTSEGFSFTETVKDIIKKIPRGRVATYGQIAAYAGNPRGARQVVRILHSSTQKDKLPWHRVVNREGRIALRPGSGYEIQKGLLLSEGIKFDKSDKIDFDRYLWSPSQSV